MNTKENNKKGQQQTTRRCKDIRPQLLDYACSEISQADAVSVEQHLASCPLCQTEYQEYQLLFQSTAELNKETQAVMDSIDWEQNAIDIARTARVSHATRTSRQRDNVPGRFPLTFGFNLFNRRLVVPAAVAALFFVLGIGIWLGYLLFHTPPTPGPGILPMLPQQASLERLETTLAKKELAGYLSGAQLVITDLMQQCTPGEGETVRAGWNRRGVSELLSKSRYLNRDLDDPQLLTSRELLKKIEWLLYEILTSDDRMSCEELKHLQDYIRKEKLLLKIRLVDKDITFNEV